MADWNDFKSLIAENADPAKLKTKRDRALYFENYLAEANNWMAGEHLRINPFNRKVWSKLGFPEDDPDLDHDKNCPLFKLKELNEKRDLLAKLAKDDPRWVFEKCGIAIFFQAASEGDFYFFQQLGKSIASNKFPHSKTELVGLRWYVLQRFPIAIYICYSPEERTAILKKRLGQIRKEVKAIVDNNPTLSSLSRKPLLRNDSEFYKTAGKWYAKYKDI